MHFAGRLRHPNIFTPVNPAVICTGIVLRMHGFVEVNHLIFIAFGQHRVQLLYKLLLGLPIRFGPTLLVFLYTNPSRCSNLTTAETEYRTPNSLSIYAATSLLLMYNSRVVPCVIPLPHRLSTAPNTPRKRSQKSSNPNCS